MIASPYCIQEETSVVGINMSVVFVGNAYGLISFKSSAIKDCVLENKSNSFLKWLLDVKPWESSDLGSTNRRWVCLKGFPFHIDKIRFSHLLV